MAVTVDLQGVLTILYTYGIRQRRAFVSMQHSGQSKVTSRSLQGQSFINSNKKNVYKRSHIVHFWIGAMYINICVAVPQNHVECNELERALST